MKTSRFSPLFSLVASLAVCISAVCVSNAAGNRKNPTSKVFVAESKGEAQIDTGEKIEDLTVKSAYSAEGTSIETKADSSDTMVFSNGSSIIIGPNNANAASGIAIVPTDGSKAGSVMAFTTGEFDPQVVRYGELHWLRFHNNGTGHVGHQR